MSGKRKQNELPLDQKIKLLKFAESHTQRKTADEFKVGLGTVSRIINRKAEYLKDFEENKPREKKRKVAETEHSEINGFVLEWFQKARGVDIPTSGTLLQEVARKFAEKLGVEFAASNGWLYRFKARNSIVFRVLSGEGRSANTEAAHDFYERLPEICRNYKAEDIFNADETGLLFRALPNKSLVQKHNQTKGRKYAKDRLSVLLACSVTGEKLKPLVIGKSKNPRCFKKLDAKTLPVYWRWNSRAWMTGNLFEEWLTIVDKRFRLEGRKILLLIDQCPAHRMCNLTNIKVVYLPANTTSLTQPLDLGIIKNFKENYRKLVLNWIITEFEKKKEFELKSVTVLDAVYWINSAWKSVKESTVKMCFKKAKFMVDIEESEAIDEGLGELMEAVSELNLGNLESIGTFDNELAVMSTDCGVEDLINDVLMESEMENKVVDAEVTLNSEEDTDVEDGCSGPVPSFSDACEMVNKLKLFAIEMGGNLLESVMELEVDMLKLKTEHTKQQKQTLINDYFSKAN